MDTTVTKENDYRVRHALNYSNKKRDLTIYLDRGFVRWCKRRGMGPTSELAYIVPSVLRDPACVFRGLRWERDEPRTGADRPGWLCYCGTPDTAFRFDGTRIEPFLSEVFLVFLDDDKYVYACGWEEADLVDKTKPTNWDDAEYPRFKEQVFQKSEIRP